MNEWIVVSEYHPSNAMAPIGRGTVDAIVDELRAWYPSALIAPDRYALQVHVFADDPVAAVRRAFDLNDGAVRTVGGPAPVLARVEVLTDTEFEHQWDDDEAAEEHPSPTADSSVLCDDLYWTTRAILQAATASELTDILVSFVITVGGEVRRDSPNTMPNPMPNTMSNPMSNPMSNTTPDTTPDSVPDSTAGRISVDLCLEDGEPLRAVADSVGVAGLIIGCALPTLVADARVALARLLRHRVTDASQSGRPPE